MQWIAGFIWKDWVLDKLSDGGRHLFIVFVWEAQFVKVITARGMTTAEKRFYGRK